MKRRITVRVISFLSAFLLASIGFAVINYKKSKDFMLQIENNYSRCLNDFTSSLNNISVILEKAQYANTPEQLSALATELLSEAEISKTALSSLPTNSSLETLNRFLSQAGNYALSISGRMYGGEKLPNDYDENMAMLSDTAQKVSQAVNTAQINFNNLDYWAKEVEQKIESQISSDLTSSFDKIEGDLSDYPTLVYDGPYSDHLLEKEPEMLKQAEQVTEKQALQTAIEYSGESELQFVALQEGKIPVYRFSGENIDITVSKFGGHTVYMRKYSKVGQNLLSYNQALEKAKRYLEKINKQNFIQTYYFIDEGVCVINFAFLDGQTICYTDLIKVGVAMDSGDIVLYEASGYLSNHKERAFESSVYSAKKAMEVVSPKLTIKKTSLALIPTNAGGEVRCYEFLCLAEQKEILVYVNVLNLKEEEILILLKSDGGILTK